MFSRIDRINVMCMIALVNARVRMRYIVDKTNAAPVTNRSRITVWLRARKAMSGYEHAERTSTH